MKNKICLIKRKDISLEPVYPSDIKIVKSMRSNVIKSAVITEPRNPEFHNKIFAICRDTLRTVPAGHIWEGKSPHAFLKAIMFELGLVDFSMNINGEIRVEVQSIAFDKMDNIEFAEVFKKVVTVCANILGCSYDDLNKRSKEIDL